MIMDPIQLSKEIIKVRKELEGSVQGFPTGRCNEAVAKLQELGFERVETIYTPRDSLIGSIGHVIAFHRGLRIYVDITADQFPDEDKTIVAFPESSPDSRYGISHQKY